MAHSTVLLSGGWESAACLIMASKVSTKTTAMFFNYGQPYVQQETQAVQKIAKALNVKVAHLPISHIERKGKVFIKRNIEFIRYAAFYKPDVIWFGARAPLALFDKYKDSNRQFANKMEKEFDVQIMTPLIMYPKFLIKKFVRDHGITDDLIFSSEGYKYEF